MDVHQALKSCIEMAQLVCMEYLKDLTDEEMMHRAHPKINHIKWQVGHLIESEHRMVSSAVPDCMPPLPAGFAEQYSKETATSDVASDFHSKEELLGIFAAQRAATFAALDKMSAADLDQPSPESMRSYAPTLGDMFSLQGSHWMMHAGQWAVVRRQLGREPLF